MSELIPFQSFYTEEEASDIFLALQEKGVYGKIVKSKEILDKTFIGETLEKKIFLKLNPEDFQRANEILDTRIIENISLLENDYYLFSYSDEELLEIINKPDEWSRQDFLIARKILNDRGKQITDEAVKEIKTKRLIELGRQEDEPLFTIIAGYVFAFLIPLVALFFGLTLVTAKKILPDGKKIFTYSVNARNHGRNILIITVVISFLFILYGSRLILWVIDLFSGPY